MTRDPYAGQASPRKIVVLAEAQNWRCAYCPTVLQYPGPESDPDHPTACTIDHVTPRHAGGTKTWDNEVAACRDCNTARGCFSAMLFCLMMPRMGFDRWAVNRKLRKMDTKQRIRLRAKLAKATAT